MLPISTHEGGKGGLLKEKYKKEGTAVRVPRSGAAHARLPDLECEKHAE